eukprot:Skav224070  [mRNA]  locus=scaffold432:52613:53713:+ [translate_table: standard]
MLVQRTILRTSLRAVPGNVVGLMPKRVLEGATQESRAKLRKEMGSLKSLTVQPVTRARYQAALRDFFSFLKNEQIALPRQAMQLDMVVSDYLEHLWASGVDRSQASNTLAALQDSQPHLKGKLAQSWRLLKTWVTHEVPNRAPPMPKEVLFSMVGYALFKQQPDMALTLLLGFHGLLRTGELLSLTKKDIAISKPKGPAVISLGLTKAGKRQGAAESITVHVEDVCRRLYQWVHTSRRLSLAGPPHKWRSSFSHILTALGFRDWDFRPYSLRRGGATDSFRAHGNLDRLLLAGRWQSARTARIYLNDGLAVLAELKLPWNNFAKTLKSQYIRSLTLNLPPLEPGPVKRAQDRGYRKKRKKRKGKSK